MKNISLANKKISEILREENNEVVYNVWLNCIENAQLEDNNIVVNVPNHYIKETFENKYSFDIESMYRNELEFSKFVVRVVS